MTEFYYYLIIYFRTSNDGNENELERMNTESPESTLHVKEK
jgi:hypothetical protein